MVNFIFIHDIYLFETNYTDNYCFEQFFSTVYGTKNRSTYHPYEKEKKVWYLRREKTNEITVLFQIRKIFECYKRNRLEHLCK